LLPRSEEQTEHGGVAGAGGAQQVSRAAHRGDLDKEGRDVRQDERHRRARGHHRDANPTLQLEQQPVDGIGRVLETYKIRITDLLRDPRFRYILLFKNFGKQAGATIGHPHSQLIAMP